MQQIHLSAPRGWINDPNGFIYYNGKYHLFYQHFPYAPQWGRMHWGHAVSDDLTRWEHLEIALFPTKTDDCDGCFSGSAIEKDGKMHLFYTGVNYDRLNPENTNCCLDDKFTAAQLHIASNDGYHFDNFGGKTTVIPPIYDPEVGDRNHTRDPKVWQGHDGNYYMILGSTAKDTNRLLFYRSADLESWELVNSASNDRCGWICECPDWYEVDGAGVLLFSPIGTKFSSQAFCVLADFNEKDCSLKFKGEFQQFDCGMDLYAPQSTTDSQGRRTVVAWLRMPEAASDGTNGIFSIPRVCNAVDGHIFFRPHPNVRTRFTKPISSYAQAKDGNCMFKTTLADGETINVGGYLIGRQGKKVYTNRENVIRNHGWHSISETPEVQGDVALEVYVSANMVEVFVNDGEHVITNTVYDLSDFSIPGTVLYTIE